NSETTRTEDGVAYQRKVLMVNAEQGDAGVRIPESSLRMRTTNNGHIPFTEMPMASANSGSGIEMEEYEDNTQGEIVYNPNHPDADEEGYVQMPNVNVITEMVDMIAATRGFEANVTAFNASKQIAKDSLEI
ncbi:partial Flagellar basal-body rod protein FlgC, partial [uncultured bacterium]